METSLVVQPGDEMIDPSTFRHERKFVVEKADYRSVEFLIKRHCFGFKEVHPPRYVNNIYFDSINLKDFQNHIEGMSHRRKMRIRWYGDQFGLIESPVLEFKIKRGASGAKQSYGLQPFRLSNSISGNLLSNLIIKSSMPDSAKTIMRNVRPVLANRFYRQYYLSSDGKFRLTLDRQLEYGKLSAMNNQSIRQKKRVSDLIIEIKYSVSDDMEFRSAFKSFPFLLTKNSKYVVGIFALYG